MSRESNIAEYKLVACSSMRELNTEVNALLALDWEVYGSPNNSKNYWYQAVVRLYPEPEK